MNLPALDFVYKLLYGNESPAKKANLSNYEYKNLHLQLPKMSLNSIPEFEIKFIKPLKEIRKYYHTLISNSICAAINQIEEQIRHETELERFHTIDQLIPRKINSLLKDLSEEISRNDLKLSYFLDLNNSTLLDTKLNEIYIFQCLRYYLLFFYVDIQSKYTKYIEEEILTLEELNDTYFNERFDSTYLDLNPSFTKVEEIEGIEDKKENAPYEITIKPKLPIYKCDIRDNFKSIVYEDMIRNPLKFSQFEELLYEHEYIDENYNFKNGHGKQKEMAIIFNILMNKNYFYNEIKRTGTEIKRIDIRKFLNDRYNSEIEKQFNDFNNKQHEVQRFQNSHPWLDKLPSC